MSELEKLREEIDLIDAELVKLLNKRAELALGVGRTKSNSKIAVYSPEREMQILERVSRLLGDGPFPAGSLERVFRQIISATRSLVGELLVSYPGAEFSVEYDAAVKQFGTDVKFFSEASSEDVFARVERGEASCGILPARTAEAGFVCKTYDLLIQSKLQIIAETSVRERLALFSRAATLSKITKVYSNSYFFSRCASWIRANLPIAQMILENDFEAAKARIQAYDTVALIGSEANAERHHLPVLASNMDNVPAFEARFIVVGNKSPAPTGKDKTSIICSVKEKAGVLRDLLKCFSKRSITLLKIESQPMHNHAWEYGFFIDLEGHQKDNNIKDALCELVKMTTYQKVLGSYPFVCLS